MRHQPPLDCPTPGQDQIGGQPKPVQERSACPNMAEREAHQREPGQVDAVTVAPEGDVVAEPSRHFRGVGHAARPCQDDHVIQPHPGAGFQAQALPQPPGDQPGPQHMLHRLAHPQIGRQREGAYQLCQPDPRPLIIRTHTDHATGEPSVTGRAPIRRG